VSLIDVGGQRNGKLFVVDSLTRGGGMWYPMLFWSFVV